MKKTGRIILLAAGIANATASLARAREGHTTGNGGDSVMCKKSAANALQGYYALDYLLTYQRANGNADVIDAASWAQSRDRILAALRARTPKVAASFERFAQSIDNVSDYSRSKVWAEAAFGLIPIDDQRILGLLPANCYSGTKPEVIQTVVRQKRDAFVVYNFDHAITSAMERKRPLQYSFLMIHEWLWDLSSDVDANRKLNRVLHSEALEKMSAAQVAQVFRNLGIDPEHPEPEQESGVASIDFWKWYSHGPETIRFESYDPSSRTLRARYSSDNRVTFKDVTLACDAAERVCKLSVTPDGTYSSDFLFDSAYRGFDVISRLFSFRAHFSK